ncbi:hypothetical protein QLQ77_gp38 [Gordonia phage Reyja]|uniref:Uncharacterized protein n=1 Tax=Gordonia phage Reyja TaxID=2571250 RepID=A0A4D6TAR1_9CAUD|nr:hypothetical protein QLQ77_gp38 [Gordonia phage Reyja]QCG77784.1 hypothetical protein SEA_REYJA_38 [Gordonia phage Reyja]
MDDTEKPVPAPPPVHKYKHTFIVYAESHDDIERELLMHVRGGYDLDSDYHQRDEFKVYGGTTTSILEHTNPEQTAENYARELDEWSARRREAKS